MTTTSDWTCMCCHFSLSPNPPLSRDAWKPVEFSRSSLQSLMKIAATPRGSNSSSNNGISTTPTSSAAKQKTQVQASPNDNYSEDEENEELIEEKVEKSKHNKLKANKVHVASSTKEEKVNDPDLSLPTVRVSKRERTINSIVLEEVEDGDEFNILFDIPSQAAPLKTGSQKKKNPPLKNPPPVVPIIQPTTTNKKQKVVPKTADIIAAIPLMTTTPAKEVNESRKKVNLSIEEDLVAQRKSDRKRPPTKLNLSPPAPDVSVPTESTGRYTTRGIGVRKSYSDIVRGDFYHSDIATAKAASMVDVASHKKKDSAPKRDRNSKSASAPLPDDNSTYSNELKAPTPHKSKSIKRSIVEEDDDASEALKNSSTIVDEVYYFGIYLNYYHDNIYSLTKDRRALLTITDDSCFLCKDGGDLVECDCLYPSNRNSRCLKTYHQGCLGFKPLDDQEFNCLRHFCDVCGESNLKYICYYCPISICAKCPEAFVEKVSSRKFHFYLDYFSTVSFYASLVCQDT